METEMRIQPAARKEGQVLKINPEIHEKVFHLGDNPPEKTSSAATRWLQAQNENVSLWIYDARAGTKFSTAGTSSEVFIYVLDGQIRYDNNRNVRGGEAVFQCPNTPFRGEYMGTEDTRFIAINVTPLKGAAPASLELMKRVIRLDDLPPVRRPISGTFARRLVETESMAVDIAENKPVLDLDDPGHPEAEIVYVLNGKVIYLNGRTVRKGECVCNIRNRPHPLRYGGLEPIRIMEICSPPFGKKPGASRPAVK
jgi:quercetin dioxygenase-like cupin family protein